MRKHINDIIRLVSRLIMNILNVVVVVSAIVFILSPEKFVFQMGLVLWFYLLCRFIYVVLRRSKK